MAVVEVVVASEEVIEVEGASEVGEEDEEVAGVDMTRVHLSGSCLLAPSPTPVRRTWSSSPASRTFPISMPPFTWKTSHRQDLDNVDFFYCLSLFPCDSHITRLNFKTNPPDWKD